MDQKKIGSFIAARRKDNGLPQSQLAEKLGITDKAVSKWERGLGCPDVSLLPDLSRIFNVDLEKLLSGEMNENESLGGNMKIMNFYICPSCGNMITAMTDTNVSCCGKKLSPQQPIKAGEDEKLNVEMIDDNYFITSNHPMTREHYIAFTALLTGDSIMLRKQYPEWDLQVRIPAFAHGKLLWYCTKHGLFYQYV